MSEKSTYVSQDVMFSQSVNIGAETTYSSTLAARKTYHRGHRVTQRITLNSAPFFLRTPVDAGHW